MRKHRQQDVAARKPRCGPAPPGPAPPAAPAGSARHRGAGGESEEGAKIPRMLRAPLPPRLEAAGGRVGLAALRVPVRGAPRP